MPRQAWAYPRSFPVLLIGAEVLPGKISVKGGACAIASATRPAGAPLTVIFARRQDARREEDGPVRYAGAVTGERYGLRHRPAGAGQLTGVRRRARRASARQGAAGRRPTVRGCPPLLRSGHGGARSASHAFSPMTSRSLRPIRPGGPDGWRAAGAPLMTVKKILTGRRTPPCQSGRCPLLTAIAVGDSPKAAASRARVRLRQQEADCRSSLDTVCALTPASLASSTCDSACWRRSSRSRWPSITAVQRSAWPVGLVAISWSSRSGPRWCGRPGRRRCRIRWRGRGRCRGRGAGSGT